MYLAYLPLSVFIVFKIYSFHLKLSIRDFWEKSKFPCYSFILSQILFSQKNLVGTEVVSVCLYIDISYLFFLEEFRVCLFLSTLNI